MSSRTCRNLASLLASKRASLSIVFFAIAVGLARESSAEDVRIRVAAPLGRAQSLDALWNRGTAVQDVVVATPGAPSAKPKTAARAATRPFDARLASLLARRDPSAAARLRSEIGPVRARLASLRDRPARATAQRAAYEALQARSADLHVAWDGDRAVFITGSDLARAPEDFLRQAAALLQLTDPDRELRLVRRDTDGLRMTHLRFQQVHQGLPVWAREATVHLDAHQRVVCFNGRLAPTPDQAGEVTPRIEAREAELAAAREVGTEHGAAPAMLLYFPTESGTLALAWQVRVEIALDKIWDVFVDARSGSILHRTSRVAYDGPVTGSGVDLLGATRPLGLYQVGTDFFNIDASKRMFDAGGTNVPQTVKGGIRTFDGQHGQEQLFFSVSDSPTNWTGKAGQVSAAANASLVYDFYDDQFGRNSLDGDGGTMQVIVNFGNSFNNAFWNGQFMVFGNGDGNAFSDLAAGLDATAHEMTHGVVEHTANLVYETQSGALNESFADVFGASAEWFAKPQSANFLIGEDVTTPAIAGDALRNMQDPAASNVAFNGQQPTRMSEFRNLPNTAAGDHGGVHINSGIPNRAFYLVAVNPALGATPAERVSRASKIYYRALTTYLTRTSQFVDCRLAVIRAAEDLHGGAGNAIAQACAQAFDTVEIGAGAPSEPPPSLPPVEGTEYISATDAGSGRLVRATLDFSSIIPLSSVAISNKPSYPDNGGFVIFIDSEHRLRAVNTNGTGEDFLSNAPVWRSIAVSPDGMRLAATSTALDDSLYLLDLTGGGDDRAYAIHTMNYGGQGDDPAQFADFLDYSNDGQFVLYDCFNRKNQPGGVLEYWDINVLRASDGDVQRVFPPQPAGIDLGNPTFSPLSDFVLALDYVDDQGNVSVLGADLEQGQVGLITNNFGSLGRPCFSTDATKVVYHYIDQQGATVWRVSLQPDHITGAGDDAHIANNGFDPIWFAVGARPAVVLTGLAATHESGAVLLRWEAEADAAHDHFVVLRDTGRGWESRSPALREPAARGAGPDRWEFRDDVAGLEPSTRIVYAVQAVEHDGTVQIAGTIEIRLDAETAPRVVRLHSNVPNPFNPTTLLRFEVGRPQPVRLEIFDAAGRRVRSLWQGAVAAGAHARAWDGRDDAGRSLASGTYVARLETQDGRRSIKMSLVR